MTYSTDEQALIWLCACTDLDLRTRVALLRAAPSPEELFLRFEIFFDEVILKGQKSVYKKGSLSERKTQFSQTPDEDISKARKKVGSLSERKAQLLATLEKMERNNFFALTAVSEDFPKQLAAADPPIVLFGAGNRALLQERLFTIVGSRVTLSWAEKLGSQIASELSERFVIVTGLAEGGDSAAIRGALPKGRLISVLPCGLDKCYPAAHASLKEKIRRGGLLLTECKFGEGVTKASFRPRNRILAGLGEGVLVLSSGERSGTLITANYAVDFNRNVFALPYSVGISRGVGCNRLIKNGAYLVTETKDILDCYGMQLREKKQVSLTDEEKRVIEALREGENQHAAIIAARTGLQVFEVTAILTALEVKGLVVKSGGNKYDFVG